MSGLEAYIEARRARIAASDALIFASIRADGLRHVRGTVKRRAEAMLESSWQLDMVEPDLSEMPPVAMVEHVAELLAAARSERRRYSDPVFGPTDLMNLMGAALAARMLRRQEWRAERERFAKAA